VDFRENLNGEVNVMWPGTGTTGGYRHPDAKSIAWGKLKNFCKVHFEGPLELIFQSRREEPITAKPGTGKKEYQRPALRRLSPEQAKLLLIGHATMENPGAKDLMQVVFPDPDVRERAAG
jgi:hypothetical protein